MVSGIAILHSVLRKMYDRSRDEFLVEYGPRRRHRPPVAPWPVWNPEPSPRLVGAMPKDNTGPEACATPTASRRTTSPKPCTLPRNHARSDGRTAQQWIEIDP